MALPIRERFDAAKRRVLALSRNLFPVIPGEGGAANPLDTPPVTVTDPSGDIPCEFYLLDPLSFEPSEARDLRFKYRAGNPPGESFFDHWYRSFEDFALDQNRVTVGMPEVAFMPRMPYEDIGVLLDGVVRVTVPAWFAGDQEWYARFGIVPAVPEPLNLSQVELLEPIPDISVFGAYRFIYRAGNPPAKQFGLHWYQSFDDLALQYNRVVEGVPSVRFEPIVPLPDTTDGWQLGMVYLTPAETPSTLTLLPRMFIL